MVFIWSFLGTTIGVFIMFLIWTKIQWIKQFSFPFEIFVLWFISALLSLLLWYWAMGGILWIYAVLVVFDIEINKDDRTDKTKITKMVDKLEWESEKK